MLGEDILLENGLGAYIPKRSKWVDSKARSLSCQINRNMDNWIVQIDNVSWEEERLLVALMMKCAILALLDSTCYSFGGQIFKQMWGAGIGLRASACIAKIVMGMIDRRWAEVHTSWDIKVYLYFRYIDDLRIFMHPISKGWSWQEYGWNFDVDSKDERSPIDRTKEEIAKSLNAVTDFIQFTTEGEEDFSNSFLPTLDFQTQVQESGKILFKFFAKPMSNNITIQQGTGLAKNTIFSALRQELVRRLLNCSLELDHDERLEIIKNFIQLLVNSGHKYAFVKSVTLQGLTRYRYMIKRSRLSPDDSRYRPLYRARSFDHLRREVCKRIEPKVWFKGIEVYDEFKNGWKSSLKPRRGWINNFKNKKAPNNEHSEKEILTAMFVPPSKDSLLIKYIEEEEEKMVGDMQWRVKLIEQSGVPLGRYFISKFPLLEGCPRGTECILCHNTGIKCSKRGVVYKATCTWCKRGTEPLSTCSNPDLLLLQALGAGKQLDDEECSYDVIKDTNVEAKGERTKTSHIASIGALQPDGMDDMNNGTPGGEVERTVDMNGMNKVPSRGGDRVSSKILSYIGETARPWRERVREHQLNLKNGNPKSFIISHWLDAHPMSVEPPEFEWKVVDAYSDALRRQLCEGLQILETGSLNKRLEFHNNNLCRMRVSSSNSDLTEKELQRELDKKKEFNGRIKKFISVMSKLSTAIEIKKKNVQNHPMNNLIFCSRSNRGAQFPIKTPLKRKRSEMDTSTPISSRREVKLIEMEEDSPIEKDRCDHSNSYDTSDDRIPLEKVRGGE